MADILLSTLNAKYIHASFGLRCLMANMGALRGRTEIREFDINQATLEVAEAILEAQPKILGMGVYIWNAVQTENLLRVLKRLRPEMILILGGPEISHETTQQSLYELADYVITGEADLAFAELCHQLESGEHPAEKLLHAPLPSLEDLRLPYDLYLEEDLAHRVVYVEASRGCPFTCEFCLSSADIPVRQFPLPSFLSAMESLLQRGLRSFKFVDRTFNLNPRVSRSILEFFLERMDDSLFLHFEMVPDRLPEALRQLIRQFPPGRLQFEVGIQSFNPEVGERIRRRQNLERLEENFRFLSEETGVHVHADLIAGLPGETLESFAAGFDRLIHLSPHEIQVGILKRLRGTPIIRHDQAYRMVYSPIPPFEILENKDLDFQVVQKLRRFARYWDLIGNSGNFRMTLPLFWLDHPSPFWALWDWSDWLWETTGARHGISLTRLFERVYTYLTTVRGLEAKRIGSSLWKDYQAAGRSDIPPFLREWGEDLKKTEKPKTPRACLPARQARHLAP